MADSTQNGEGKNAEHSTPPEEPGTTLLGALFLRRRQPLKFGKQDMLSNDLIFSRIAKLNYPTIFITFLFLGFVCAGAISALEGRLILTDIKKGYGFAQDFITAAIWILIVPSSVILLIHYVCQVPRTFKQLIDNETLVGDFMTMGESFRNSRITRLVFHNKWFAIGLFVFAGLFLVVAQIKNISVLESKGVNSWLFHDGHYTAAYFWTYGLTLILFHPLGVCVFKIIAIIAFLFRAFRLRAPGPKEDEESFLKIRIRPLHPDGAGGLKPFGDLCLILNLFLFLMGIIITLIIAKNVLFHGESVMNFKTLSLLGFYVVFAPLLFFLPMWTVHAQMKDAKATLLEKITRRFNEQYEEILASIEDRKRITEETIEEMERVERLYEFTQKMPIWPFNLKNLSLFVGTVVVPVGGSLAIDAAQGFLKDMLPFLS
jgi:hypothetical protein